MLSSPMACIGQLMCGDMILSLGVWWLTEQAEGVLVKVVPVVPTTIDEVVRETIVEG